MPVCAVTVGGFIDASIDTDVRCAVVSTSSVGDSHVASGSTEIGDQLCFMPRGRMRQPFACAQFASVTTSCGDDGVAVQIASIEISPDQLRYACLKTGMRFGKFGGSGHPPLPVWAIDIPGSTRNAGSHIAAPSIAEV